ncbi:MAG: hypothetical protein ICV69_09900 [Thermoleophilaceae bacterium]|nr:hypothetical protein [Thermoleophilaceae bacterium]
MRSIRSKSELFARVFRTASQRELELVVGLFRRRRAHGGLVGPLSARERGSKEVLVATLVQFC